MQYLGYVLLPFVEDSLHPEARHSTYHREKQDKHWRTWLEASRQVGPHCRFATAAAVVAPRGTLCWKAQDTFRSSVHYIASLVTYCRDDREAEQQSQEVQLLDTAADELLQAVGKVVSAARLPTAACGANLSVCNSCNGRSQQLIP